MKSRMVWKLSASFAAVLLLFTLVLGIVFVSMSRQHVIAINRTPMEEKAVSIADTLSSFQSGRGGVEKGRDGRGGYGAYLRFLDDLAMAEVWIVDEELSLLTMSRGHSATSYEELPDNAEQIVKRVFQGEITYGEEFSSLMDTPTLTVGAPIYKANGVSGVVLLHSPANGVNEAVRQGLFALGIGIVVALISAGATAVLLSYQLTSPLRLMNTAARRLADGDYTPQTCVMQKDEIGQLAQTIDLLSGCLRQAEQEREALDRLKQNFVANVSHELRTPVAVLCGSLEVLREGIVSKPEEVLDYYDQMIAESRHLERLVNDLLDLSRLQDAQFQLEKGEVNLCHVIWDTERAIRRIAQRKQIEIHTVCPKDDCMIYGDFGRIRQIVLILLDNAVKFSYDKGVIELVLEQNKDGFCIMVADHGPGISPEELPFIFDRFRKTHNMQNKTGTGLGLAIAKQIADRHHALLRAESADGYTRFFICFTLK